MQRVLRSCLDPLPRLISLKSLIGVVLMVLAGTGLSVYEYLETAVPPVRAADRSVDEPARACAEEKAATTRSNAPRSALDLDRRMGWGYASDSVGSSSSGRCDPSRVESPAMFDAVEHESGS